MPVSPSVLAQRLLKIQSTVETSWGTYAGSPTCQWRLIKPYPTFKPYRKSTVFDEAMGNLAPGFTSAVLLKGGEFNWNGTLSYEDAVLLGCGFFGTVTPTGSATPYTWTFTGPTTSQGSITPYSFTYNQTSGAALATGCIFTKLDIKGVAATAMEYTVSGLAQDIDAGSGSPAALSLRTVEAALTPSGSVYLDSSTIGSTIFSSVLTDFDLAMENSIKYIWTAGALTPSQWVVGDKFKATMTMSLLYTSAVKTFITGTLMAGTTGLVRIKASGSGSSALTLDFAGVLSDDPVLFGNKDGAQLCQVKLGGIWNASNSLHTNMTVANGVSTLP